MNLLPSIALRSEARRTSTSDGDKAKWGQYFTPPGVAWFMAGLVEVRQGQPLRILDPGAGTGMLGAAVALVALERGASSVQLVAVEAEGRAQESLRESLAALTDAHGDRVNVEIVAADFLDLAEPQIGKRHLDADFDVAIANPPYFKMSPSKPRGGDAPNAYARFMDVASRLLKPDGQLVFIIPRSYTSGLYFKRFRKAFHARMNLERVHIFESRREAFKKDNVLQENVIVRYRRTNERPPVVAISTSESPATLEGVEPHPVARSLVMLPGDPQHLVLFPSTEDQERVVRTVRGWSSSLRGLGLRISTGPVVPFRTDALVKEPNGEAVVPLLWMQHVKPGRIVWPKPEGMRKPEYIRADAGAKLLVDNANYVLLRRFSAKEEARRLTAAVYRAGDLDGELLGLENHLNFIHLPGGELDEALAFGVAGLLSSTLVDDYFRIANGNTQVNATDIRSLPMPRERTVRALGRAILDAGEDVLARRGELDPLLAAVLNK